MSTKNFFKEMTQAAHDRFVQDQRLLSFAEYLQALQEDAPGFCRTSAQYIRDAFDFFGEREIETPMGVFRRFRLFDKDVVGAETWVAGQEMVQEQLYRRISNFVREGRNNRLLLLHGPNGSGKTSLVAALMRALELYSHQPEGLLYRFNWIFPAEKLQRSGIGFGASEEAPSKDFDSYAHLQGDQIEARLTCPLKDHPLLLLPHPERNSFLEQLKEEKKLPPDYLLGHYLIEGDLCHRCRMIFDALLGHYDGDFEEVLRHVQVERFYISQRYRHGAVTIEPQMHVDAQIRQVTADRSLSSLPKALSNLNLFEPTGPLVDANRGLLEYSDLLKRPLEAFKYLLSTCETRRANVEPVILFFDLCMVGTANENNLDRFKEVPEFTSFKGRMELLRTPYLLRYADEEKIYETQLQQVSYSKHIAPHLTKIAALWAVLTRMRRPLPERLPSRIREMVASLTPLEKAHLYDRSGIPDRFTAEEAKELRKQIPELYIESQGDLGYEGRIGASPRELRTVILNAAQNDEFPCLSPLALLTELQELLKDRSVYEFLQLEAKDGYYDPGEFVVVARNEFLDLADRDVRTAMGLVAEQQHDELFRRYVNNVKAFVRKEKIINPITHAPEEPDRKLMENIEKVLLPRGENVDIFRQNVLNKIGAYSLDHGSEGVNLSQIFSLEIERLEKDYFSHQVQRIQRIARHCLAYLVEEKHHLSSDELKQVKETLKGLEEKFGYCRECSRETIAVLLRERYTSDDATPAPPSSPPKEKEPLPPLE